MLATDRQANPKQIGFPRVPEGRDLKNTVLVDSDFLCLLVIPLFLFLFPAHMRKWTHWSKDRRSNFGNSYLLTGTDPWRDHAQQHKAKGPQRSFYQQPLISSLAHRRNSHPKSFLRGFFPVSVLPVWTRQKKSSFRRSSGLVPTGQEIWGSTFNLYTSPINTQM